MQTLKEKVYLLTTVPYRDSDLIVNLLSETSGKLTSVIYGGRKIGKQKSFAYCSGDLIEIEYTKPENRDFIKILNSAETRLLNADLFSYNRFICHTYLIELIAKIAKPELPADELYSLLTSYETVEWVEDNPFPFIGWMIWMIIRTGGYQIDFDTCDHCGRESWQPRESKTAVFRKERYTLRLDSGKILCSNCVEGLPREESTFSSSMIKMLWLFETTSGFEHTFNEFPKPLTAQLVRILNRYLLKSFDISPNSLDLFHSYLFSAAPPA